MAHHHCKDFSRSALLRGAAAEGVAVAGRGLPAIEAGMPTPAGTGLSRRSLLLRSAGLAVSVYGASALRLDALGAGVAQAATGPEAPIVVSVFLEGGADSLSILAPTGDPRYRRLRPHLALPESAGSAFAEDDRLRWHPSARGISELHSEGKVTVFPAIGYDHPDQSHFTSRHYWEVGSLDARASTGWLGRYLDQTGSPDNPLQGLALDGRLSPALATARVPVAAVDDPGEFDFWSRGVWGEIEELMLDAFGDIGAGHAGGDAALSYAGNVAAQAGSLRRQLLPFKNDGEEDSSTSAAPGYPKGEFAQRLAGLSEMIAAGLPLRCVAVQAAGEYDTHDNQEEDFDRDLQSTADSLLAFQRDLEARGLADRVLVHVWSEFGRRAEENGSNGTDHGAGGVSFLIGTRVRGQMVGEFPGLERGLDADGNLRATSDFRSLYCSVLEQWLGVDAAPIIPGAARYARPALLE